MKTLIYFENSERIFAFFIYYWIGKELLWPIYVVILLRIVRRVVDLVHGSQDTHAGYTPITEGDIGECSVITEVKATLKSI